MLNEQIVRLLTAMHIHPPTKRISKLKLLKSKKSSSAPKFANLPDNVWDKILDNLSPFETIKMRRVCQKLKTCVDRRRKRLLYADFLRTDVSTIIPAGQQFDEETQFYKHSKSARIIAHEESRSILIIVDTQWTPSDAVKIMAAIRYYGAFAHTVTLDASLAELCVASQSTSDIPFWFAFQMANGTSDPVYSLSESPNWVPDDYRHKSVQTYENDQLEAYKQWTPRTQLIPIGPIFPKATEVTIRSSIPQLRRLRRFGIYKTCLTRSLVDSNSLNMLRLVISTNNCGFRRARQTAQSLKLAPFLKWANVQRLGHRFCVQFA